MLPVGTTNGYFRNQCPKPLSDKGKKKMNMETYSQGDALICEIKNSSKSWIIDYGALFHASNSIYVMHNFWQYIVKVRLVDNKSLHIMGVGDVILMMIMGTNWTLKNVEFIPDVKRMLIPV